MTGRIDEMQADLAAFAEARKLMGAPAGGAPDIMQDAESRVDHAGRAFGRAMDAADGAVNADLRMQSQTSVQIDELEQMQRASDIGARLAALKARRAG